MKKKLLFSLAAVLFLCLLTGCNRTLRRDQTPQEPTQPVIQATDAVLSTSAPVAEVTATQAQPTDISTAQPTNIVVPTQGISQSDTIANQLEALLGQFDSQLQGVDTIPENP